MDAMEQQQGLISEEYLGSQQTLIAPENSFCAQTSLLRHCRGLFAQPLPEATHR